MAAFQGARMDLRREMRLGFLCSGTLHLLVVIFAIFGLPHLLPPPPEIEEAVPVELAPLGDKTTPPPPQVKTPEPKEQPSPPQADVPIPPPKPEPAPPPPPPKPAEPTPTPVPVPQPKPKPPEPKPQEQVKPVETPKQKPRDDFLSSMQNALQDVDKRQSSSQPLPSATPLRGGSQNVNSRLADSSGQPTMSEKDFIRAQIEKCWNFDPGALGAEKLVVRVRIMVQPDGTVTRADLDVDRSRYMSDPYYQAAADSARRAPLACSPLKIPPNRPDFYKSFPDITLNFDPRSLIR